MKKHLLVGLLLMPITASAQNMGGMPMTEAQMQQMMQQAKSMQNCMANIDQAEMEAFKQKAEALDSEVKALCAAGKRDAAMARALAFGKEAAQSNIMQDMKKCGEGMKNMMPMLPKTAQTTNASGSPKHICDQ
ncbi:MAG: hypothetical protein M0R33_16930 [Methylomonas sp.]|jgi:ABC-type phosphate transport system auxiliary subunit|uniref:hypothetical protein n=1 Tax=Methylomonas sp. TaxID=418 RepID=UPI0025FC93F6|nr:hypothetical protein [Methylomonas sp.]MCK9608130.1 hypothetical protein [Methylomonas sp.]